jgi:hypothetical protein
MKIGIITFHRAVNYGAVLQAYALRRVLGYDNADIIDYRNPLIEKLYCPWRPVRPFTPRNIAAYLINIPIKLVKNRAFRGFLKRFAGAGGRAVKNNAELLSLNGSYSAFVTGSDQVWNHDRSGFDETYFLGFADEGKKFSYAASFGFSSLDDKYAARYRELLQSYSAISVREEQGSGIVEKLLGSRAEVVLDPTLLLDGNDWADISGKSGIKTPGRYILLYVFELTQNLREFVLRLSDETGLSIIWVQASLSRRLEKAKKLYCASPEDFLKLFQNASYVVTNSFHGLAFSLNFNREFFIELLPEQYGVNSRLEDLISRYKLADRAIDRCKLNDKIDYGAVNERLREERGRSLAFIQRIGGESHL